ncbi:MAG: hypothetical protein Kow00117_00030 [Phototrophicales bacterium]
MDDSTTAVLAIMTLVTTLVFTAASALPRLKVTLRPQPAYNKMPSMIGNAIESDRPLHISLGSAGIGGESTVLAVAVAELAYQLAKRATIGDTSPILTLSNASAFPLAQDTLRRAYQSRGMLAQYSPLSARWYPAGERSLAFAAALTTLIPTENISGSVLAGSYGIEIGLIMDASQRKNQLVIGTSDQLDGQAVAYVLGDAPLIGEEVFTAGAYLEGEPGSLRVPLTIDALRWVVIAVMLIGLLVTLGD